jgi:hypothetical protein
VHSQNKTETAAVDLEHLVTIEQRGSEEFLAVLSGIGGDAQWFRSPHGFLVWERHQLCPRFAVVT